MQHQSPKIPIFYNSTISLRSGGVFHEQINTRCGDDIERLTNRSSKNPVFHVGLRDCCNRTGVVSPFQPISIGFCFNSAGIHIYTYILMNISPPIVIWLWWVIYKTNSISDHRISISFVGFGYSRRIAQSGCSMYCRYLTTSQ